MEAKDGFIIHNFSMTTFGPIESEQVIRHKLGTNVEILKGIATFTMA